MKKSKVLLTLMCAVALVVTSVFGTLAYLQDTDEVKNTFTVGNVQIKLDEKDITKTDGTRTEEGNKYHLLPGHVYDKDPTVTVLKDSENSYVRMLVTVDYKAAADEILAKYEYLKWFDFDKSWTVNGAPVTERYTQDEVDMIKRTYEFRYNEIVAQNKDENTVLPALFNQIEMPGEITNEELATIAGLQIDVVAQAIQADSFEGDVNAAWAAFAQ